MRPGPPGRSPFEGVALDNLLQVILITLRKGAHGNLEVHPRWTQGRVWISEEALLRLHRAQGLLPPGLQLIIVRGFEPGSWGRRIVRHVLRKLGSMLFKIIFPSRSNEATDIFHANGHDVDGNHVDVGIRKNGRRMKFLPFGVFSRTRFVAIRSCDDSVETVWRVLASVGFKIHRNPTEALQIHCDLC